MIEASKIWKFDRKRSVFARVGIIEKRIDVAYKSLGCEVMAVYRFLPSMFESFIYTNTNAYASMPGALVILLS